MSTAANGKLIQGATGVWEVVIGMEVHAQVTSNAKLFSGASTAFGGAPNSHVSLVDAAMPGMLPVINEECVRQAIRTGLGLNARVNLKSVFDRKNYFYPDLPQGYQISQYKAPIVGEGEVAVELADGETITVGIERLHLEQDAGKSLHDQHPTLSFVDLNRSGVALMEIVSKPDLRSAEDAKTFLAKVRTLLRYLGTCDGDMEKGNLRADVNVSVRRPGEGLGTRCEIKNVNSIRFVGQAIDYEARRQIGVIEDGGTIEQETRLFDPVKGETRSMRNKEEAHDYRYFPDPDLLPLEFTQAEVDELRAGLPELPDARRARFIRDDGLSAYDAEVLVAEKERADFYECMDKGIDAKTRANWVINQVLAHRNKTDPAKLSAWVGAPPIQYSWSVFSMGPTGPAANSSIVAMTSANVISVQSGRKVLDVLWDRALDEGPIDDPRAPPRLVEELGLKQVTDVKAIEKIVDDIIAANPDKVSQAKAKPALIGWFVGQAMRASGGRANPQGVNELLKRKLGI
jgi:aspartyl-tRNA(Asn)/glutamyl-tRNA(Gln) amidotransferase subunit B